MLRACGFPKFTTLFCPDIQGKNREYSREVFSWRESYMSQDSGPRGVDFRPISITDSLVNSHKTLPHAGFQLSSS